MRTPMENGFGSIGTPAACSISKVSRALCPMASSTSVHSITVSTPSCTALTAVMRPFSVQSAVSRVPKRTSPP